MPKPEKPHWAHRSDRARQPIVFNCLGQLITPNEAEEALSLLLRAEMLKFENGTYVICEPVISTGVNYDPMRVWKYHESNLKMWCQEMLKEANASREMGLLNIPIDREKIPELKERVVNFQKEIIGWLSEEANPNELVQLGIYLMPLTKID